MVRVRCETTLGDRGENWLVVLLCVCVAAVRCPVVRACWAAVQTEMSEVKIPAGE